MKRLLVAAAVAVALLVATATAADHSADFENLDSRIDELTARISSLQGKINTRVDPARISRAHSLEQRVVRLEGSGCGKREFQCGSDDPQCIGSLLVCDGQKDCRNGQDEAQCELPTNVGAFFEGHVIKDTCTKRRPEIISFQITAVRRDTYFNAVAFVRANIIINYKNDLFKTGSVSLPTQGYYSFGASKLVLLAPEDDRLGLTCDFDGFNVNRCEGEIKQEGSLTVCATLLFTRKN